MVFIKISYIFKMFLLLVVFLYTNVVAYSVFTQVDRVIASPWLSSAGGNVNDVTLEKDLSIVPKFTVSFSIAQELGKPRMLNFYAVVKLNNVDISEMVFGNNILCHLQNNYYICRVIVKNLDGDFFVRGFNDNGRMIIEDLVKKPKLEMFVGHDDSNPPCTILRLKNVADKNIFIANVDCGNYIIVGII